MDKKDLFKLLFLGGDIKIHGVTIKNYSIQHITEEIGWETYNQLTNIWVVKDEDLMQIPEEDRLTFVIQKMQQSLGLFLECEYVGYSELLGEYALCVSRETNQFIPLHKEMLGDILDILKTMYVKQEGEKGEFDESKAVDADTAALVREFREFKEQMSRKQESGVTMDSIIETVASCSHRYDVFNVGQLKIYQLMRIFYRIDFERNSRFLLEGYYGGNINSEKFSLREFNWAKDI